MVKGKVKEMIDHKKFVVIMENPIVNPKPVVTTFYANTKDDVRECMKRQLKNWLLIFITEI